MTFDDYRKIKAINWSTLKHLDVSELHYHAAVNAPQGEPSDAMLLGTAFHTLTLEPDKAAGSIAVWTGKVRSGGAWVDFQAEHTGKTILRQVDYDKARRMADAVRRNPSADWLLSRHDLDAERTVRFDIDGRQCKARLDGLSLGSGFVLDLKSTQSLDERAWPGQVARMGYHGQLAFYDRAAQSIVPRRYDRIIIACESAEPHDVAVFALDDTARIVGVELVDRLLRKLNAYDPTAPRGRYPTDIIPLSLPAWAVDEDEPEILAEAE